jgi:hypothetical protein
MARRDRWLRASVSGLVPQDGHSVLVSNDLEQGTSSFRHRRGCTRQTVESLPKGGADLACSPGVRLDDAALPERPVYRLGLGLRRVAHREPMAQEPLVHVGDDDVVGGSDRS